MSLSIIDFPIDSAEDVARKMHEISRECRFDTLSLLNMDLFQLFDYVKNIPYIVEDGQFQSLSRPYFTMRGIAPYTACANKSIVVSAYCKLVGIDSTYKLVSLYHDCDYHHVYPVVYMDNQRIEFDATYPENVIGRVQQWSKSAEIEE